jgi:para-nitrobenzyl esterase
MKMLILFLLLTAQVAPLVVAQSKKESANTVKTANGMLEGVTEKSSIRSFKGIPFAAAGTTACKKLAGRTKSR